jgi:hypothetical protein
VGIGFARGIAAFRIFFGLILFTNGLAKLFEFRTIELGPYRSFLINKAEARRILEFETTSAAAMAPSCRCSRTWSTTSSCRAGTSSSGS